MKIEDYKRRAIDALSQIDPTQPYGQELFEALARLTITVSYESVCLRNKADKIEVLLTKRKKHESYAGQWHTPGGVVRPGESDEQIFERLSQKEFEAPITSWKFVSIYDMPKEARGHFKSQIYLVTVAENHSGEWFDVNNLPANTVEHHVKTVIPTVVNFFKT